MASRSTSPYTSGYLAIALLVGLLQFASASFANIITRPGDPVDLGIASDSVCCVDAAAVNLLNFLNRTRPLIPSKTSVGEQQEDFHRRYDPAFSKSQATSAEAKSALEAIFRDRGFSSNIKFFGTSDLSLGSLRLEFDSSEGDEEILLFMREVNQGFGHAVYLWGLDSMDEQRPRLSITDFLVHPNMGYVRDDGMVATNGSGVATVADLKIGMDANGKPDWTISYSSPAFIYTFADGTEYETDARDFKYRILSFLSVSDVQRIPEPSTLFLVVLGIAFANASYRRAIDASNVTRV